MAVVVTIAKGYDLGYIWKPQDPAALHCIGGYYIDAAQAGEPPGRWWGPGAQALGLAPGQDVDRQPYDAVYRQTDPRTGARLGRARGRYPTFADHLARLTAAEPHATAERLIELERQAAQATGQPAAYYDVTISFSKSISVLHASIRENERRARMGSDRQAAAYWAGREQAFQEGLHKANRAALEYLQAWAGITRGTDANLAFVFTTPSRPADPQPATRAAPELGRYDRARRERAGYRLTQLFRAQPARPEQREPIAVLADVLSRDGAEPSASVVRQRNLAGADHLAVLNAIWTAETQAARHDRYRELVTAALPPGHRQPLSPRPDGCSGPCTPPNSPA